GSMVSLTGRGACISIFTNGGFIIPDSRSLHSLHPGYGHSFEQTRTDRSAFLLLTSLWPRKEK
ncbi:MAG: hypothetical protein KY410_08445, partial [Proteobacteria bacterium]|nr:hypothetical protein [Pseudomonadota bacterium]